MVKEVKMGLSVLIFPDEDMKKVLNQNIGNSRFVWNQLLKMYNETYALFKFHGYPLKPTFKTLNAMLNLLKKIYPFLKDSESSSLQQVARDLSIAFNRFFKGISNYPTFKRKKRSSHSFRIQKNGNNVRVTNKRIRLAKLEFCHYRTSRKYKKLLKESKINNVTVKRENGYYYAMVNIETSIDKLPHKNKNVGIDLGIKNLATLSNGEEITNLDLEDINNKIKKYQRKLQRQQKGSNNYKKTLKKLQKQQRKKKHKLEDAYHKFSKYLVKTYDIIAMEDLNIKGMFQNKHWSAKLQKISLYKLVNMIKYKSEWYGKKFIQIDRFFPSSKICHVCGYYYKDLTIDIREWTCPSCKTHHKRDVNAAINILNEGLRLINKNN